MTPGGMPIRRARIGRVRAALLSWLGVPITLQDGEFWREWGGNVYGKERVSVDSALQLSAGWSCVRLISETVATLPLGFYQTQTDGTRKVAPDHPLYELLHNQPNADMTAVQFWEAIVASMLLRGAGYGEKQMIGNRIVAIDFLIPQLMERRIDRDQNARWYYHEPKGVREIPESRLLHIPGFSLDGKTGLSPMSYARRVVGGAQAAEQAAEGVFTKGLRAAGFMQMTGFLKKEQREQLRDNLKKFTAGGEEEGSVFVAEGGSTFKEITMNPEDAQMLQTRAFGVEEICRWFRVPPWMVGHTEKSTSWGTGIEQQMIGFVTFTLRPWLSRIEQSIRRSLLTPAERSRYFAEFAIEGLLRADSAGRSAFYSTMVQNGIYTRDDCRVLENREPMGGNAAVLTVQSNLVPIDKLGAKVPIQTSPSTDPLIAALRSFPQ